MDELVMQKVRNEYIEATKGELTRKMTIQVSCLPDGRVDMFRTDVNHGIELLWKPYKKMMGDKK